MPRLKEQIDDSEISDLNPVGKIIVDINTLFISIKSLVTYNKEQHSSDSSSDYSECSNLEIENKMASTFDIKTAIALLPVMTGQEHVTLQLIDGISLYSKMISETLHANLIEFVLKTRLSASAKLRLQLSYDTVGNLIQDMKSLLIQKKSEVALQTQLLRAKQGNRSIDKFGSELEELFVNLTIAQANGDDNNFKILRPINEKLAIKRFADGLSNTRLSTIIASRNFVSLPEAIRAATDEQSFTVLEHDVMSVKYQNKNPSFPRGRYNHRGFTRGSRQFTPNNYENVDRAQGSSMTGHRSSQSRTFSRSRGTPRYVNANDRHLRAQHISTQQTAHTDPQKNSNDALNAPNSTQFFR